MKTPIPPIGTWDTDVDPRLHAYPDWGDNTREVEIVNDGVHVVGELRIDDWGEADGEEFPMFTVRDAAGQDHSFAGSDKWRFLS